LAFYIAHVRCLCRAAREAAASTLYQVKNGQWASVVTKHGM
jgi:hypothetical protein